MISIINELFDADSFVGPHLPVSGLLAQKTDWNPDETTVGQREEQLADYEQKLKSAPDYDEKLKSMKRIIPGTDSSQLHKELARIDNERQKIDYMKKQQAVAANPNSTVEDMQSGEKGSSGGFLSALPFVVAASAADRLIFNGGGKFLTSTKNKLAGKDWKNMFRMKEKTPTNEEILRPFYRN